MAAISLKGMAKEVGLPYSTVQRYCNETKEDYLKRTGKTEDELTPRDWQYIMGVVKKRIWYKTGKKYYEPKPIAASNFFKEKLRNLLLETK